eukprot:5064712-Prymnesium_polylepis.1
MTATAISSTIAVRMSSRTCARRTGRPEERAIGEEVEVSCSTHSRAQHEKRVGKGKAPVEQ